MRGHSEIEDGNWIQVTGFLRARDASMHMMARVQSPDASLTKAQVMGPPSWDSVRMAAKYCCWTRKLHAIP